MNRTTRLRTNALVALALTVASGCSPRDASAPTESQSDSARVTIYENSGEEWTEATAWRLSSEPTLTIGAIDGPEEYVLFQVKGARRLSTGNILIANSGTRELRFYDPSGTHMRSVGRRGFGPGDFRSMGEPWPLGSDSIAIWDNTTGRLTVFDLDGELGRSFRLDPMRDAPFAPRAQGIFADNSLLVSVAIGAALPPEGLNRRTYLYARYSLEGAHLTTHVRRPGNETNVVLLSATGAFSLAVPYGRIASVAVFGDRWYYGSGDSWEIEVYSPDGALTHLFRRDEPNRPVTQEMMDEYPESPEGLEVADLSARSALRGWFVPELEIPETLPAYRSLMVSDDGNLWVENYTRHSEQPSWAVFRDDGRYLGEVETPMGARVTHIGDDFVLVIWEDELEVQQVQMYGLIKP